MRAFVGDLTDITVGFYKKQVMPDIAFKLLLLRAFSCGPGAARKLQKLNVNGNTKQ